VARRKLAMEVTPLCLASAKIRKAYTEGRAMQGYAGLLRLNAFRGDPASSEFDWNFSPNPNSSPVFSTTVSSDLHNLLQSLHPDQD
jgi:hypothetical protein